MITLVATVLTMMDALKGFNETARRSRAWFDGNTFLARSLSFVGKIS